MSSPGMSPRPLRRRSLAGPIILILVGLLFLMRITFGISLPIFSTFARWWPLLLIIAGVVKVIEGIRSERTGEAPTRLGGGTVFLIIMLCIFGSAASAIYLHRNDVNWGEVQDQFQMDDDFMHLFGSSYTYDGEVQQVVAPNTSLKVLSDRGSITVTAWDQPNIKAVWHKRLYASNQSEADKTNAGTNPQFSVSGDVITLTANTQGAGPKGISTDLEIYAPKKLAMDIAGHRGDVLVNSREGNVKVELSRGDVTTEDIIGNVTADLRRGSVHADKVTGEVNVTGRLSDVTFNEVQGPVVVNGDIFGEIRVSQLSKGIRLTTSRTTLELQKLDGELDMDSGQLQIDHANGPVSITTRAKDITLDGVSGDIRVNNDVGEINVDTGDRLPLGNIEINGRRGDVRLHLPSKAQFAINASTRHGEVSSDFGNLSVSNPDRGNSVITGGNGRGGAQVTVSVDSGDIRVNGDAKSIAQESAPKKQSETPATTKTKSESSTPVAPEAPKAPKAKDSAPSKL